MFIVFKVQPSEICIMVIIFVCLFVVFFFLIVIVFTICFAQPLTGQAWEINDMVNESWASVLNFMFLGKKNPIVPIVVQNITA